MYSRCKDVMLPNPGKHGVDPDDAEYAGPQDDANHGSQAPAQSPGGSDSAVYKSGEGIGHAYDGQPLHVRLHHHGALDERGQKPGSKGLKQQPQSQAKGIFHADEAAPPDPVLFSALEFRPMKLLHAV